MREIEFRAKRINNGEWVEGFYYEHGGPLQCLGGLKGCPIDKTCIVRTAFGDWDMPRQVEFIEVVPETAGQYINQVDRNLKKIYENDILQDNRGNKYCVRWSDGNCGFIAEPIFKRNIWPNLNSGSTKYLEVIGNCHDNSELLESEK